MTTMPDQPMFDGVAARKISIPEWLPADARARIPQNGVVEVAMPRALRSVLHTKHWMIGGAWVENYRMVPEADAFPGKWRFEHAPHTREIIDTFTLPTTREIWMCGVEQSGKTNTLINCMSWCIDIDPANCYYLMPTQDASDRIISKKITPTLRATPQLRRYLSRKENDTTKKLISLNNGMSIFPAHAQSATSLATFAAKYVFGDEVDKYERMTGKEADPITLLHKRHRNYKNTYKAAFASTPNRDSGGYIYKGMMSCQQVNRQEVRCPHCGEWMFMDADHLDIPEGYSAQEIEDNPHTIGYVCHHCSVVWDEQDREAAIRAARWTAIKGADIKAPAKIGYHHKAYECLDVPLAEIAAAYTRQKNGSEADKVAWVNGYEAENYTEKHVEHDEDGILLLCDDRPALVMPSQPVAALLLTVDTQKDHFWYVLRAHGYGMEKENWLVSCGQLETFAAIEHMMLEREFLDKEGNPHRVAAVMIDTGGTSIEGQEQTRTYQVYDWARKFPGFVYAMKGAKRNAKPHRFENLDFFPNGKAIPGGLRLWHINTLYYKRELDRRLSGNTDGLGAFHLHSGYTAEQLSQIANGEKPANMLRQYAKHLTAECLDKTGIYVPINNRRHDLRDCEYMQIGLAEVLQVATWARPDVVKKVVKQQGHQHQQHTASNRPSWFSHRGR